MTQLSFSKDNQGLNTYGVEQPVLKYSSTLTNGANASITIPSSNEVWIMGISYQPGTSTFVSVNGTAAFPVGATFATTDSELNPPVRKVLAADVVDFITASATAYVTVSLWELPIGN